MTPNQKTIKNFAVVLAIILIVLIVAGAVSFIASIANIFSNGEAGPVEELYSSTSEEISSLRIELEASKLTIKLGDSFKVESSSKKLSVSENNGTLAVIEKKQNLLFGGSTSHETIIYIPVGKVFDRIDIETGAGDMLIEKIACKTLELDLGAGNTEINMVTTTESTKIDSGVGNLDIHGGSLQALELDWGVGNADINAALVGKADIDTGVGNFTLKLSGNKDSYKISANKGVGDFTVDGLTMSDGDTVGSGENEVSIDSGVGTVKINFETK